MNYKQKLIRESKKKGYNVRYDDYEELKNRWIDMSDICKFITSKLLDDDYFTPERILKLKKILSKIENTGIDEFIDESEIDEVF